MPFRLRGALAVAAVFAVAVPAAYGLTQGVRAHDAGAGHLVDRDQLHVRPLRAHGPPRGAGARSEIEGMAWTRERGCREDPLQGRRRARRNLVVILAPEISILQIGRANQFTRAGEPPVNAARGPVVMGTLRGFPCPPAMVRGRQSRPASHAPPQTVYPIFLKKMPLMSLKVTTTSSMSRTMIPTM